MKRNNLLLFSYIIFVCICVVVQVYTGGFERWDAIVTAVAISSALLTCADYYSIYANYFSKLCDTTENFIGSRRENILEEEESISKLCEKFKNFDVEKVNLCENKNEIDFDELLSTYSTLDSFFDGLERDTCKNKKTEKQCAFVANALTVLAFLVFLCIITFSLVAEKMHAMQDIISVFAFVIILGSQYISSLYSKKLEEEQMHWDELAELLDQQRAIALNICNKWMSYLQEVEVDAN